MPRFDDGVIDMQELLRRLVEQVANAVMDARPTNCAVAGRTNFLDTTDRRRNKGLAGAGLGEIFGTSRNGPSIETTYSQ